jgi:hypothetical protein
MLSRTAFALLRLIRSISPIKIRCLGIIRSLIDKLRQGLSTQVVELPQVDLMLA